MGSSGIKGRIRLSSSCGIIHINKEGNLPMLSYGANSYIDASSEQRTTPACSSAVTLHNISFVYESE